MFYVSSLYSPSIIVRKEGGDDKGMARYAPTPQHL